MTQILLSRGKTYQNDVKLISKLIKCESIVICGLAYIKYFFTGINLPTKNLKYQIRGNQTEKSQILSNM